MDRGAYDIVNVCILGAALLKGLNRTCGTFLAGALGVGVHHISRLFGEKGEPVVLGIFVFLIGKRIFVS